MGQPLLITQEHLRHRTPKNQLGEQRPGQASPRVCPVSGQEGPFPWDLGAAERVSLPPAGSLLTSAGSGQQPGPEGFIQLRMDAPASGLTLGPSGASAQPPKTKPRKTLRCPAAWTLQWKHGLEPSL